MKIHTNISNTLLSSNKTYSDHRHMPSLLCLQVCKKVCIYLSISCMSYTCIFMSLCLPLKSLYVKRCPKQTLFKSCKKNLMSHFSLAVGHVFTVYILTGKYIVYKCVCVYYTSCEKADRRLSTDQLLPV